MYITMMGGAGLTRATEIAILNANYVAAKLKDHYPVLYTGSQGRVAHECILDVRAIKAATGVAEIDIAKRLMDYGFHAPTVSFPVAGTLMVEPTESGQGRARPLLRRDVQHPRRDPQDRDRRMDAGAQARSSTRRTPKPILIGEWTRPTRASRPCSRCPGWPRTSSGLIVNRIDDVYGDRNLFCGCVPMEDYS
jgi:glycine dehydrogenase